MGLFADLFPAAGRDLRQWLNTNGARVMASFASGREALDWLRSEGGAIRTSDFYDIRRSVMERQGRINEINTLDANQIIPAAKYNTEHGWNISTQFLYPVTANGYDPNTGLPVTRNFSVASDVMLTPNNVLDTVYDVFGSDKETYEINIEDVEIGVPLALPSAFQ